MEGKKFDNGKPPLGLVHGIAITEIAKVLDFGAKKYDRHNWLKGMKWSRVYDALLRHTYAWIGGEDKDSETSLSHLAHMGCCIMFLIVYEKLGIGEDDRYKPERKKLHDDLELNPPVMIAERGPQCEYKRINTLDDLKLTPGEQIQSYIDAGYDEDQAKHMVGLLDNDSE